MRISLVKSLLTPAAVTGMVILAIISGCAASSSYNETRTNAAHELFGGMTEITEMSISRDAPAWVRPGILNISRIEDANGVLGYIVESEVVSRSGPFKIRVFLDRQIEVKRASVISYPWKRGRDVRKRDFVSQFEGKGPADVVEIGKDIDAITGATISSRVMTEGVHDSIKLVKLLTAQ
jgi:hypothetical protein